MKLIDVLTYCPCDVSENHRFLICKNFFFEWMERDNSCTLEMFLDQFDAARKTHPDRSAGFAGWDESAKDAFSQQTFQELCAMTENCLSDGRGYDRLANIWSEVLIRTSFFLNDQRFLTRLREASFLLPPLETGIDQDVWHYCRQIAIFNGLSINPEPFIAFLEKLQNSSGDSTVQDRCKVLIQTVRNSALTKPVML